MLARVCPAFIWAAFIGAPFIWAACDSAPAPTGPASSASATASAIVGPKVVVRLDGAETEVAVGKAKKRLAEVLPESARDPTSWRQLTARSDDGRTLAVRHFVDTYPDHELMLYQDEAGRPSLGIFRKAVDKPHIALVGASTIEVHTRELVEEKTAPPTFKVALDDADQTVDAEKLAGLPRQQPPGGGDGLRRIPGWHLRDFVALYKKPEEVASVTIATADGESLEVTGEALRDKDTWPLLRYNRRGELGFMLSAGTEKPRRLRGITRIAIKTR